MIPKGNERQRDNSKDSRESDLNLEFFDLHNLIELKTRFEDEVIKNENLERHLRSIEFTNLKKVNELQRKV